MTEEAGKRQGPLAGIRVLDLSAVLMGPYCTQILSDMGADVIKVEPAGGDIARHLTPMGNGGDSATFRSLNRGKRGIAVDLSNSKGREVCLKLAASCDVFVHSIRPQAIAKLGLGYDDLNKASPNIVYCNLLGFGRDGRYSGSAAYDDTIQALSGLAWLQSQVAGRPQYVGNVMADKVSGLTGVYAILGALFHRERSGQGQEIDVPMFETIASFVLVEHLTGAFYDPPITPPVYSRAVSQARRPYATSDGHLAVLVYNDKQWRRFAAIAGREELLQDGRFETVTARSINIEAYYDLIASIIATRSTHEWLASLGEAGIPVARVNSTADLFEDPHLIDVGFFISQDDPRDGPVRMPAFPVRFSMTPAAAARPGPALGEHTVQVLQQAGFDSAQIESLLREGVIVQREIKA